MVRVTTLFVLMLVSTAFLSQDRKINGLERMLEQGNYRKLVKRVGKLEKNPRYSEHPKLFFYQALALIELKDDKKYTYGHVHVKKDIQKSIEKYWKTDPKGKVKKSFEFTTEQIPYFEEPIKNGKAYGSSCIPPRVGEKKVPVQIKDADKDNKPKENGGVIEMDAQEEIITGADVEAGNMIEYAQTFIGTPYKYGGSNGDGFDCSGFTSHVNGKFGKQLPRSAQNQYNGSTKIDKKDAKPGDLVFFGKGKSSVSHVGLVKENTKEGLIMIHSSSSRGIMESNIDTNSYWKPRFVGVGQVKKK